MGLTLIPAPQFTIGISGLGSVVEWPFLEKQPAQGFQVVQDSATVGHLLIQFRQVSGDKLEGLLVASRAAPIRPRDVGIHVALGLVDGFDEQFYKLFRAFDVVKWSLWSVTHAVFDPLVTALPLQNFIGNLRIPDTTIAIKTRLKSH